MGLWGGCQGLAKAYTIGSAFLKGKNCRHIFEEFCLIVPIHQAFLYACVETNFHVKAWYRQTLPIGDGCGMLCGYFHVISRSSTHSHRHLKIHSLTCLLSARKLRYCSCVWKFTLCCDRLANDNEYLMNEPMSAWDVLLYNWRHFNTCVKRCELINQAPKTTWPGSVDV